MIGLPATVRLAVRGVTPDALLAAVAVMDAEPVPLAGLKVTHGESDVAVHEQPDPLAVMLMPESPPPLGKDREDWDTLKVHGLIPA